MKISIKGCNNEDCWFFNEGQCDMPNWNVHPQTGTVVEEVMEFDYDHKTGKITCKNCEEK